MVAHSRILLSKCTEFRRESEFIDVRLKIGDKLFPAHRVVLASYSDYFHSMFIDGREANQEVIELKDTSTSPEIFKIVLDSIYTGDLHVNQNSVFEVLLTASQLQVASVVQLCCDFVKKEFIENGIHVKNYSLLCTSAERLGLRDLKEAAEAKMASMYKDVCESKEFLTHINADQLLSLLGRDDLNSPSEAFIFKSAMKWIKYKGEERMAVAGKIIGAVRLGLVDVKIVIEELKTEEMQQIPEVNMHLQESMMHHIMPSHEFAAEKVKPRSMSPVLVAIHPTMHVKNTNESQRLQTDSSEYSPYSCHSPQCMAYYFDVEAKLWKPLPSLAQFDEKTSSILCAEHSGNYLFVAGKNKSSHFIHRYDVVNNSWVKLPKLTFNKVNCLCVIGDYLYAISELQPIKRYSLKNNSWQGGEGLNFINPEGFRQGLNEERLSTVATTVLKSRIYVIHGYKIYERDHYPEWVDKPAVVHCFDPKYNEWKKIASTCHPHVGSCLFVVDNKLCVAGGNTCDREFNPAPVEVYDEATNTWSIEPQKHIPPNDLGAVEIEGRVYFIIKKFPVDSGIRIPPEEMYQVDLREWENLSKVCVSKGREGSVVLCYLPVKGENLK